MKSKFTIFAPVIIATTLALPILHARPEDQAPGTEPSTRNAPTTKAQRPAAFRMLAKGSDIVGLEVRNYQDEKLGEVDDLIVDVGSERVTGLLIGVGGVLGVGETSILVPLSALHYDTEKKILHLESTKDALKSAPRLAVDSWQETDRQAEVVQAYRFYGLDVTGDRNIGGPDVRGPANSLTPTDQNNNPGDLAITARIRKELMDQSDLSVKAQNVKIITVNGRVTLRGSVASSTERDLLVRLAEAAAPGRVDDQLEVNSSTVNR